MSSLADKVKARKKRLALRDRVDVHRTASTLVEKTRFKMSSRSLGTEEEFEDDYAVIRQEKERAIERYERSRHESQRRREGRQYKQNAAIMDMEDPEVERIERLVMSSGKHKERRGSKKLTTSHEKIELLDAEGKVVRQADCYYCNWQQLKVWFRHPTLRAIVACSLIFGNFYLYSTDPIAHSHVNADIPIIGHDISLLFHNTPTPSGLAAIKVFFAVFFLIVGMLFGRQIVHHRILRDHFRLKMFSEDKGTWMVMFFVTILVMAIGSQIYNGLIVWIDDGYEVYKVGSTFGMSNVDFMKLAASGTWTGDYLTAYMVIDMMLQDDMYPSWLPGVRQAYRGWTRIVLFWGSTITLFTLVITFIVHDVIDGDSLGELSRVNELTRSILASWITAFDLMVVMQDWEFPTFSTNTEIKLPGFNTYQIKWRLCDVFGLIVVTGRWFNFGIIFIVMMLDMNMLKNQVLYSSAAYGQYPDDTGRIWTITNQTELAQMAIDPTPFVFENRVGSPDNATAAFYLARDEPMNALFEDVSSYAKTIALIPALSAALLFVVLIKLENPKRIIKKLQRERELVGDNLEEIRLRSLKRAGSSSAVRSAGGRVDLTQYETRVVPKIHRGVWIGNKRRSSVDDMDPASDT